MKDDEIFVAKSLALMNYLCNRGYQCFKVRDSEDNPEYKVFYFKSTPELELLAEQFIINESRRCKNVGKQPSKASGRGAKLFDYQ